MAIEYSNNFHTFLWNEFIIDFIIDFITGFYYIEIVTKMFNEQHFNLNKSKLRSITVNVLLEQSLQKFICIQNAMFKV